jgi:hypothetical protein
MKVGEIDSAIAEFWNEIDDTMVKRKESKIVLQVASHQKFENES